jgi:hypothetical protein
VIEDYELLKDEQGRRGETKTKTKRKRKTLR